MTEYVSMSAVAKGRTLTEVADDLLAQNVAGIEIAIGPRPVISPSLVVNKVRFHGVGIRAHHSLPLGSGRILRPSTFENARDLAGYLALLGIKHYSMHPPRVMEMNGADFYDWFFRMQDIFETKDISFAVETMYPDFGGNTRNLANGTRVFDFLDVVKRRDPDARPLVLDVGHVYIGRTHDWWSAQEADALIDRADDVVTEVHHSSNNGQDDQHRKIKDVDLTINGWMENLRSNHPNLVFVDEARR